MTQRLVVVTLAALLVIVTPSIAIGAGTPTPPFSGALWQQDQFLTYKWKTGQVPPAWLQQLVHAAAGDASSSRGSRAATFAYSTSGTGTVSYDEPSGCGAGGLACARRNPPYSFSVSFRRQGAQVQWGTIRWCHAYTTWPSGCFDAELSGLHEFGHVLILDHASAHSYPDTVMSAVQAAYPQFGSSQHFLGRCDVATLQKKYDMHDWSAPYSTCLDLASTSTVSASATSVRAGTTVTFRASVRTIVNAAYEQVSDNPLHGRNVMLQRAAIGSASWVDVAAMTPGAPGGIYTRAVTINASYQWRVSFRPSGEGVRPSTSGSVIVRIQ